MPAGPGFGGVLVRQWNTEVPRPRARVFADQEGGTAETFRSIAPWRAASAYRSAAEARAAGARDGGGASARRGSRIVRTGARPARRPARVAALSPAGVRRRLCTRSRSCCVREALPGPRLAPASTDVARVWRPRSADLAPFRAIRAGVPCVMVGHAICSTGSARAARRSSRRRTRCCDTSASASCDHGFARDPAPPARAAVGEARPARAGADLVLTTSADDARRMIEGLVPLTEAGELDSKLVRVLRYRRLVAGAG